MRRKSPPVLTPLLLTLVLLNQAPAVMPTAASAALDGPITVLIAPPDTAGVPGHVVEFAQEHVSEQGRAKGLTVIRMKDALKKLPSARRRALLKCKRTELRCLIALGETAKSEVVLVAELLQRVDGYRVGVKIYKTVDGGLLAENLISGVREDGMLDALTQSLEAVMPQVIRKLRPDQVPPEPPKPPEDGPKTGPEQPPVEDPKNPPVEDPKKPRVEAPKGPPPGPKLPPTPEPKANLRRWAWMPAAVGVASAGVGTFFFLQARSKYTQLDSGGDIEAPLSNAAQLASDGRKAQSLSRITLGVGAAALATAGVFYLFPGDEKPVKPTVSVGPGGGMVGLVGTWP